MAIPTIIIEFSDPETFTEKRGVVLNSAYCPVRGTFMLLVSTEDGPMKTIPADQLGLMSSWVEDAPSFVMMGGDNDEDDEDEEEEDGE
jgi:hypothetical protein